jgi:hypothetical protein
MYKTAPLPTVAAAAVYRKGLIKRRDCRAAMTAKKEGPHDGRGERVGGESYGDHWGWKTLAVSEPVIRGIGEGTGTRI